MSFERDIIPVRHFNVRDLGSKRLLLQKARNAIGLEIRIDMRLWYVYGVIRL